MKKAFLFFSSVFLFQSFVFSQTNPEIDSKKIIQKGIELHDEKKYAEAIYEFRKVNGNDTNYVLACIELANTYIANEQDSMAVVVCDQAAIVPSGYAPNLLLYKANALDNLKRSDEAEKLYLEGIKKYPLNNSFYFELGILKYRQKKYKESHEYITQSVKYNPFHAASHNLMANLAVKQGKIIPAMLAWQYYLLLDNSSSRAMSVVTELEKLAKNEYDFSEAVQIDGLSEQDDFSELEALLKSKAALSDKYKSKLNVNYNVTKQLQLIFEKLKVTKGDKGFYMNFYGPIVEELNKKGYFEPFAYQILGGVKNKDIDGWNRKHKEETTEFIRWLVKYLGDNYSTFEENVNGKKVVARHWYKDEKIFGVGNLDANGEVIGYWNYYFPNGILRSEGLFNNNNKREGVWKFYYPSGLIRDLETYKDGVIEGRVEEYFTNGSIRTQKNFAGGLLEGLQTVYFSTGVKKKSYEYKADKQEGKETEYFNNGKLHYDIQNTAGKYNGPLVQYFSSGHVSEKATFKDDKRVGKDVNYYNYPENVVKSDMTYENGLLIGEYKSYYRNGKVEEEGTYNKSGEKNGVWKEYYDNGVVSSEENVVNGKNEGTTKHFDEDGKLTEEYIYKNDILQEYKAYDPTGKVIYQNKKDGRNNYDVNLFYPNGNKKVEGKVLGGKFTGLWKNYNMNGILASSDNYIDGKKDGKSFVYYENEKVKSETEYKAGETDGFYRQYHKNGKVRMEGAYIHSSEIGVWTTYQANGMVERINFYDDGELEGWQKYYAVNGKIDYEEYYELGYIKKLVYYDTTGAKSQEFLLDKGTGEIAFKYPNGKLSWKVTYKNNLRQGLFIGYYPDGSTQVTKNFVDDELEGEMKTYYLNGKVHWSKNFQNGLKHGLHIEYAEDGTKKREQTYRYDKEEDKFFLYYANGKPSYEYDYKDNQIHGKSIFYAETGDLAIERHYKNGYLMSYSYFDKNGVMVPSVVVKNETANVKSYYKSGTLALEYTIKNGMLEGKRTRYHANGKVQEEDTYLLDDLNGQSKEYYANGKLLCEETYVYDNREGKCTYYYANGNIKREDNFVAGKLHGASKFYDETGKLIRTIVYYNDDLIDVQ